MKRSLLITVAAGISVLALTLASPGLAGASSTLIRLSADPYHNPTSQHRTELEPDTFSFGNTVVSAFQVGRFYNGGASNIGWATSTNGGQSWSHGFLPKSTVFASPAGIYDRVSDPSVAYDARHKVWMISYLGLFPHGNGAVVDVVVSRSTDGGLTWGAPVPVNATGEFNDKNWTACDDTASSPFYGHCYTEFDNASVGDRILMSTSADGGLSWGSAKTTANHDFGIGGQPLAQPNGTVIVPIVGFTVSAAQPFNMKSFISTDGGATWSATTKISFVAYHIPQGVRATIPLPSAEIDASGKVYVVWSDCRFETGCNADDLVLTTSSNGLTWTGVQRVPINAVSSGSDHFIPGLAVDRTTSGANAHLGLAYYFYPVANCQTATCALEVGFVSSTNGGTSWSTPIHVAGPMSLTWLPLTTQGYMVGDYISTSIVPGDDDATPVFAVASPPTGTALTCIAAGTICHEAAYTTSEDLATIGAGAASGASSQPVYSGSPFTISAPPRAN